MESQMNEVLNKFSEEFILLLEAKTIEDALLGFVAYMLNGIDILREVASHFED